MIIPIQNNVIVLLIVLTLCFALFRYKKRTFLSNIFLVLLVSSVILTIVMFFRRKYVQKMLRITTRNIIEKFNEHDVKYWVDYGTLLGIVREGDIILHDHDADICLFPDNPNIEKKLVKITRELGPGHILHFRNGRGGKPDIFRMYGTELAGFYPLSIPIDLYTTKYIDGHYVDESGKLPEKLLGNTKKIDWNGLPVSVPEKTHETLIWRYGDNYMTPIIGKGNERFRSLLTQEGYSHLL